MMSSKQLRISAAANKLSGVLLRLKQAQAISPDSDIQTLIEELEDAQKKLLVKMAAITSKG